MKVIKRAFVPSLSQHLLSSIFALIIILLYSSSPAQAAPSANIVYSETSLGGGFWQYNYTFYNTSSSNEYLYTVYFDLTQEATVDWLNIPTGWYSTTAGHTPVNTIFLDTYSNNPEYDIAPGSSLGLFSFTIDYQVGDISYDSYFDDHQGGISYATGTTTSTMVPEPVSSLLFIFGAGALVFRRFHKYEKNKSFRGRKP